MNSNLIRTALTWAAIAVSAGVSLLGCASDAVTGAVDCSASWVPPQYAGYFVVFALVVNQIMKANQGGTFGEGLVKPTVVVNPTGKPGTVTPAQVNATGPGSR